MKPSKTTLSVETTLSAEDVLNRKPVPAKARLMKSRSIGCAIVVDEKHLPIGILTSSDLIGEFPS